MCAHLEKSGDLITPAAAGQENAKNREVCRGMGLARVGCWPVRVVRHAEERRGSLEKRQQAKRAVLPILIAVLAIGAWLAAESRPKVSAVDVAGMDRAVRPGDDFYDYANGGWMKTTEIPADRSIYASFTFVDEEVEKRVVAIIQNAGTAGASPGTQSSAAMVGAYYDAFMNEAEIEKRGLAPLKADLDAIAAITDKAALARVLGKTLRADCDALNCTDFYTDRPFGLWAAPGFADPSRYAAYLLQGGLGMPDRDNYLKTDPEVRRAAGQVQGPRHRRPEARERSGRGSPRRPRVRARAAHRRVAWQPDRLRRRAQGEQSLEDGRVRRESAGARLGGVLRGRGPLGPADDHGLAPGRRERARGARRQ